MCDEDYLRFLISLRYFNDVNPTGGLYNYLQSFKLETFARSKDLPKVPDNEPLVDILCYCLNINHFHLLLKQKKEDGVSNFMQKLSNSYTQYFNKKHKRSGVLFQGKFRAFEVKSEGKLWETSFYINGNAEIHKIDKCDKWPWSSCSDYLNIREGDLCSKNEVLKHFKNISEYKELLFDYIREKKAWKEERKEFEK